MANKKLSLLLCLLLSACVSDVVRNAAPPIEKIADKDAPDETVLPIIASQPVAADPIKAIENYHKLLELQPDSDTKAEAMRRMADLQVQVEDIKGNDSSDGEKSIRSSIKLYNQLLYDHPEDKNNDRIFYQLARAYQNAGEVDAAIDSLERLNKRFPDSELSGDAHFRRAELLFSRKRYSEAEAEYKNVMDLANKTPFFEPSQYKFGWARYKQANYEGALDVFLAVLDRELPKGELYDTDEALKGVARSKNDLARDSLRVASLSLVAMGGGKATNDYLAKHGDPRFYPLVYSAVGEQLLDKRRYTDAAETYTAFIQRYPGHLRAPAFQSRVIHAYADGGFNDLVVQEKERYATTYDPSSSYWAGRPVSKDVLAELRLHMDDLARHYQAAGQLDKEKNKGDFIIAAKWYRRVMQVFPQDPKIADTNFLLAQNLFDGGQSLESAQEYSKTAYGYPNHPHSADAAYAAVYAYEKYAGEVPKEQRDSILRKAIDAGTQFSDKFPGHPEVMTVLTHTSEDLYELKSYEEAITVASRVLKSTRPVAYQLRRSAWSVTADSHFALQRYAQAELAYTEELKLTTLPGDARTNVIEQLAASIYKQGEVARTKGDMRTAANQFLRVAQVTPDATIRPTADYDAGAALIQLKDWSSAERVLEGFRSAYPSNPLQADVDKKLAVAYQADNKPLQAAEAYQRVAARSTETAETRRDASWLAATLYDQAKAVPETIRAYESYLGAFPQPLERAMDARERLAAISKERGDNARQTYWLKDIVAADESAGSQRSDRTRALGARASLDIGRYAASEVRDIRLSLPLEKSLPRKKAAMENAIQSLGKAAAYGFADVATAATHELGLVYQDFGKSLMDSDRPGKMSGLELEQYNTLLEEQAFPFEEKAISTYETNLKNIRQGVFDDWVVKSYGELLKMAPAKYGKNEKGEEIYETLR
jgi:TolA-binding protein